MKNLILVSAGVLLGKMSRLFKRRLMGMVPDLSENQFGHDYKEMVHEIETYHAELDAQNIELRESQYELLKARDRYRELYDFAPVGYATFNRMGCILDLNLTLATYFSSERDSAINTPFVCWLARDQSKAFVHHLNMVFVTQEKQVVELALKGIDGSRKIVRLESMVTAVRSEKPKICKSIIIDITHEKEIRDELKIAHSKLERQVERRTEELSLTLHELNIESSEHKTTRRFALEGEERYKMLFCSVNESIVLYEAESGLIIDANPSALNLYGYTLKEIKRQFIQQLFVGGNSNAVIDIAGIARTYDIFPKTTFHKTKMGELIPVEVSIGSFLQKGREVVFVIANSLQERFAAEARLRLAAEVFESANEAIMIADPYFKIVMVNPAFTVISGFEADEAIGRDARTFMSMYPDFNELEELGKLNDGQVQCQHEVLYKHKSGHEYHAWESFSSVKGYDGSIAYFIYMFSDISQLKKAEAKSSYLAHHDPLTRLPNRLLFNARLDQSLQLAKRHKSRLALLFLDLDRFKYINDTLGHVCGDALLREIATRIESCVREQDTVARFGGDEFTVLLSEINQEQEAANIASKILHAVAQPLTIDNKEIVVSASIGISLFPRDGRNSSDLIKAADLAMYCAKDSGRHRFEFYARELTARSEERMELEHNIRDGLTSGGFFLCYQPQFDVLSGKLSGVEALLRWRHANGVISTPEKIISIAEESSLILDLDAWVLRAACEQAANWYRTGIPMFKVAINFSAVNLIRDGFVDKVQQALEEFSLPAEWLELEVTERVLQSGTGVIEELNLLKNLGVSLAIDDFGTGYSSLSALKHLPIDRIKIDRSFIADVPMNQSDAGIAEAIINMGHNLNLKVVAEGVENDLQWHFLQTMGCDDVQGFRFGKPELAANIPAYLGVVMLL